jgi:hypothetical protein
MKKKKVFQGNISPSLTFGTGEKSISFLQAYSTSVKEKASKRSFSSPLKREALSRLLNNLNKREMDERVGREGIRVDCSFCRGIREGGVEGYSTQKASSGGLLLRCVLQQNSSLLCVP